MTIYSKTLMNHFLNPRNVGEIPDADASSVCGNQYCGDVMQLFLKIVDVNGEKIIKQAKFKAFGCPAAIACGSITTEILKDKTIDEALKIKNEDITNALGGLPPIKIHCAILSEESIKKAIENFYGKSKK